MLDSHETISMIRYLFISKTNNHFTCMVCDSSRKSAVISLLYETAECTRLEQDYCSLWLGTSAEPRVYVWQLRNTCRVACHSGNQW